MALNINTRKDYEEYLNGLGVTEEDMIIGGKPRRGRYGSMLRRHDPTAFEVGYHEWCLGR